MLFLCIAVYGSDVRVRRLPVRDFGRNNLYGDKADSPDATHLLLCDDEAGVMSRMPRPSVGAVARVVEIPSTIDV